MSSYDIEHIKLTIISIIETSMPQNFAKCFISKDVKKEIDEELYKWIINICGINYTTAKTTITRFLFELSLWKSLAGFVSITNYHYNWLYSYMYTFSSEKNIKRLFKFIKILKLASDYNLSFYDMIKILNGYYTNMTEGLYNALFNECTDCIIYKLLQYYTNINYNPSISSALETYIKGELFLKSRRCAWIIACIIS